MIISLLIAASQALPAYPDAWILKLERGKPVQQLRASFQRSQVVSNEPVKASLDWAHYGSMSDGQIVAFYSREAPDRSKAGQIHLIGPSGKRVKAVSMPKPFDGGKHAFRGEQLWPPVLEASYYDAKLSAFQRSLLVMDAKGHWNKFQNATKAISGRHPNELFIGFIEGGTLSGAGKLAKVAIVDRKTGSQRIVSGGEFRSVLWPSAKAAFDLWGAVAFFINPVSWPGFPTDPAYVMSGLGQYTDEEDMTAGKSAVFFPNGKMIEKYYHGSPLIATTVRGNTM
ncbi:MAG: hypothetical protein JNK63_08440 [Chthonomonas sp.]|nr:hypothetical protein [Chthonomonas sp.]